MLLSESSTSTRGATEKKAESMNCLKKEKTLNEKVRYNLVV